MYLKELIEWLEDQPKEAVIRHGFGAPDSFRGYYEDLAFEPVEEITISQMLGFAKSCIGRTFTGYKGGEFTMGEYTECWISPYGSSVGAAKIGNTIISLWEMQIKTQN